MKKCVRRLLLAGPFLFLGACAQDGTMRSPDWLSSANPPTPAATPGGGVEGYYWYGDQTRTGHMDSNYRQPGSTYRPAPSPANNTGPR
ncbi:MAG: hypothetical protein JSS51_14815 [Planctomycetes bacterium]|nr:hypothetical protein [Planctomycetota bacterium]